MACSALRPAPTTSLTAARASRTSLAAIARPCSLFGRAGPTGLVSTRTGVKLHASVVDAPTTTTAPVNGTENVLKRPPIYKVFLHNDNYNKREYVVKVLLKVVEKITVDDALTCMQEAHERGCAVVVACPQDNAERYCEGLRLNGLTATIEPGGC